MKIILENEIEKWAWDVMMRAHYKWEKNYGRGLQDQMDWYFEELYKEETDKAIKDEIDRRLRDNWGDDYGINEEEYVANGLKVVGDLEDWNEDDITEMKNELREEYEVLQEDIAEEREMLTFTVEEELRSLYYTFFNAPEKLTVIFNGETIQEVKKKHP